MPDAIRAGSGRPLGGSSGVMGAGRAVCHGIAMAARHSARSRRGNVRAADASRNGRSMHHAGLGHADVQCKQRTEQGAQPAHP